MKTRIILSALASIVMLVGCEDEKNGGNTSTQESYALGHLSFSDCISGNRKAALSEMAAVTLSYKDSNLLKVELFNTEFCCGTDSISILDTVAGTTILLELIDYGPFTWCFCYHDVTFDLGPLAEDEYTLTFIESENAYQRDTFQIEFVFDQELDTTITEDTPPAVPFFEFDLEQIIKGGCNEKQTIQDEPYEQSDTIIFTPGDETLNIFVGLNYVCCYNFTSASHFESDTLIIDLEASTDAPCDCMCYYTFEFIYSGYQGQQFFYEIWLDDELFMEGNFTPDL